MNLSGKYVTNLSDSEGNWIGRRGASAIAEAIKGYTAMVVLGLSGVRLHERV
jgi:hypothetical protein